MNFSRQMGSLEGIDNQTKQLKKKECGSSAPLRSNKRQVHSFLRLVVQDPNPLPLRQRSCNKGHVLDRVPKPVRKASLGLSLLIHGRSQSTMGLRSPVHQVLKKGVVTVEVDWLVISITSGKSGLSTDQLVSDPN